MAREDVAGAAGAQAAGSSASGVAAFTPAAGAGFEPYRALYLHLPFCTSRCAYCDFDTSAVPADDARIDEYVEALSLEVRRAGRAGELGSIRTVYVGGGTPSHAGMARLSMLLYTLSLSARLEADVECTMEANPESLTERMVRDVWALGVNRLSLGVQSLDDAVLRLLGRAHDADGARRAVAAAQTRFENVSVDLMCGIPGQSDESFARSVREAVALGVAHVSVYPLSLEEGTPMQRAVAAGRMPAPDDDAQATHMAIAAELLGDAGFARYEVASYARPGFSCRHNIAYWTGVPYLGLGRSAVTMRQRPGVRERLRDGRVEERLGPAEAAAEDLMLGMRMACGVSDAQVAGARALIARIDEAFEEFAALGLATHAQGRWRPTDAGWLCGNELYGRLLFAAED